MSPPVAIICLEGDVSGFSEKKVESAVQRAEDEDIRQLIFNFERTNYINSSGLSILFGIATKLSEQEGRMAAVGLTLHYQKIFKLLGLNKFIEIYTSTDAVLKEWVA